jgi:hypothetical protein
MHGVKRINDGRQSVTFCCGDGVGSADNFVEVEELAGAGVLGDPGRGNPRNNGKSGKGKPGNNWPCPAGGAPPPPGNGRSGNNGKGNNGAWPPAGGESPGRGRSGGNN